MYDYYDGLKYVVLDISTGRTLRFNCPPSFEVLNQVVQDTNRVLLKVVPYQEVKQDLIDRGQLETLTA